MFARPKPVKQVCRPGEKPELLFPIEAFGKGIYQIFTKFSGSAPIAKSREFTEFLVAGVNAFYLWEQILTNKMGLGVRPLNTQELWADLWARVNNTPAPPVPQRIFFDGKTATQNIYRPLHPLSILINEESSLPTADYRWIRTKDKFVGVMSMLDQPDEWSDKLDALTYLWNKCSDLQ
jgi:hypothetical protein